MSCFCRNRAYLYFHYGDGDADLYDMARNQQELVRGCQSEFPSSTVSDNGRSPHVSEH